ncbi:response regulator [Capilliphycus salinus ALCB114379]|uniref:hybrid sensor histidine kinase/response regulator n=1 Tax=Capilliphycus salinus TaxID=2768948 RepID=UPI0039A655E3
MKTHAAPNTHKLNLQDYTILIVDDHPTNLRIAVDYLEDCGLTVLVSQDGESALKRAKFAHPHLILLDVLMPGIDGFETCRRLKADPETEDIPVIFMTALASAEDKVKGFQFGAVDYVTKPIQHEEVLARVSTHLHIQTLYRKLEEQNQNLQQKVIERTAELSQALADLQQSQIQLVQSEKMSALGQLVAGVAHEINNPLSCLTGNLQHATEYIQDLLEHLHLYQQQFKTPGDRIKTHAEDVDLDYITDDIPKVILSLQEATQRIHDISKSLYSFSHSDTSKKVPFDLHQGIESTLTILKHRFKTNQYRADIEIVKNYGNLPLVHCYPGQINQVFMNLIANAIDALDDKNIENSALSQPIERPIILIKTWEDIKNKKAMISIKDNGSGMSELLQEKIFSYLFTTKPIGKGTGLGLSISRQIIVEKHGGRIHCISELGKGSEFIIELPILTP